MYAQKGLLIFRANAAPHVPRDYEYRMYDCASKYCRKYLDRRYLQYDDGNCECGVLTMEIMGIQPATLKQETWRRQLYLRGMSKDETRSVLKMLLPTFRTMGLKKPYMVAWYIISKDKEYFNALISKTPREKEGHLWAIVMEWK